MKIVLFNLALCPGLFFFAAASSVSMNRKRMRMSRSRAANISTDFDRANIGSFFSSDSFLFFVIPRFDLSYAQLGDSDS